MQVQAFNDPDCKSSFTECLYLQWNLNNQPYEHDQNLTPYHTITTFNDLEKEVLKKLWERENAGNQHFLLLPQCFPPFPNQISIFESH